ncbi:MAG TPA: lasso peptide biosynthesis B2 protein [Thermoleophilaceae bacterium]|nr:lasso peptide biosynthesis B2 protein [Thermoleophilaceae bacterium]
MRRTSLLLRRSALAAEAGLFLTLASVATRLLPSSSATRLLGRVASASSGGARPAGDEALLVGRAVNRVTRLLPWHPTCLPQAIATRAMLRRRRIDCISHLGVVETDPFRAHAWVTVNGSVVQGRLSRDPSELARFT